jgi:hypothetical protein
MKSGPEPYERFLTGLVQRGITPVLVAGQAVNYWVQRYADRNEKLKGKGPFVSGDLELYRISIPRDYADSLPSGELIENDPFTRVMPADAATCYFDWDGNSYIVQVMRHVEGLLPEEVEKRSVPAQIGSISIKVLDPLALCKAKAANLLKFSQAGRQDLRHLGISILCSAEFIRDILIEKGARPALNAIKRMKEIALSIAGNTVRKKHFVNWDDGIPWADLEARRGAEPSITHFLDSDAPQWRHCLSPPLPLEGDAPDVTSGGKTPKI